MKQRRNILYLASHGDLVGGGERYLVSLISRLDRNRFRPIVVLPWEGSLRPALEAVQADVHSLDVNYRWLVPLAAWYKVIAELDSRVGRVSEIIKSNAVDLVHTNCAYMLEGALAARKLSVHHIWMAHNVYPANVPLAQRINLDLATYGRMLRELSTQVIAVSQSVADSLAPPLEWGGFG